MIKNERYNNKFIKFIVIAIFIDVLLLPNFKYFVMPLSLPFIMVIIFTKRIIIKKDTEFWVFIVLSLLVLTSTLLSFLQVPNYLNDRNLWIENIKRAFQLLTSFGYFFIIKECLRKLKISIKKILLFFVGIYVVIGIISITDIDVYFSIKEFLGVRDPNINEFYVRNPDCLYRYSYIWVDPNNVAYAFQMVIFYLLTNERLNILESTIIYLALIFSIIISASTGALLSAILFITLFALFKLKSIYKQNNKILLKIFSFSIVFIAIVVIVFLWYSSDYQYLSNYSFKRMLHNTDGGRLEKYSYMFGDKLPNLIGEGYTLIRNSNFFRPHSDHLRFLYSYGIIAYLISIWFFFRKVNLKFLFTIPAFMAYSINSLIDEQKVLLVFLTLLAYVKTNNFKTNFKKYSKGEI